MPDETKNLRGGLSTNVPMRGENVSFALERLQHVHNIGLEGPHGTIKQSPVLARQVQGAVAQEMKLVKQLQDSGQATRFESKIQDVYRLVSGIKEMVSQINISKTPEGAYLDLQATVGRGVNRFDREAERRAREAERLTRFQPSSLNLQRAQIRVARSALRGGRALPGQWTGDFETEVTRLEKDISGLETRFTTEEGLSPKERVNLSEEITSKSNVALGIRNILSAKEKIRQQGIKEESWIQQARVRVAQSVIKNGRELDPRTVEDFKTELSKLDADIIGLENKFGSGKGLSPTEAKSISTEITGKSKLAGQLKQIIDASSKDQKTGLDKVMGFVSNLTATMAIGTLATHKFITDPFTYGFKPAMNVMGQQGLVGSALGSAYLQEKQYDIGFNQRYMMLGAGSAVAGVSMMRNATGGMRALGGGMALVGGIVSTLSAMGVFNDILQKVGLTTSKGKIIQQSIAQTVANPQTLLQNFAGSTAGLLAAGAGPEFGYYYNTAAEQNRMINGPNGTRIVSTGNKILDQLPLTQLRGLGYTGAQLGELMSQTSLMTKTNSRSQLLGYTNFTADLAKSYGISEGAAGGLLQTAQRAGSQNAQQSVQLAMGAAFTTPQNANFAMSVLVPALLKVTESLQLQNVARNNKELATEVANLYHSMSQSNTPLGNIIKTNPQEFAALITQIQAGVKTALNNPALMAYDLSGGSSFTDVFYGRPIVAERNLLRISQNSAFAGINWKTAKPSHILDSMKGAQVAGILGNLETVSGVNTPQEALSLLIMARQGHFLSPDTKTLSKEAQTLMDKAKGETNTRVEKIVTSELGDLRKGIVSQVDAMTTASQAVIDKMQQIQDKLLAYASGDQIMADAKAGMTRIVDQINKTLGNTAATTTVPGTTLPTSVAAQASGNLSSWLKKAHPNASVTEINKMEKLAEAAKTYGTSKPLTNTQFSGIWSRAGFGKSVGTGIKPEASIIAHAGKYAISDNKSRVQSGAAPAITSSAITDNGGTVNLTMSIDGMSVDDIAKIAHKTTSDYVVKNKLMY